MLKFAVERVVLDIGYWILDIGYWILDIGYWILDIGSSKINSPSNSEAIQQLKPKIN